MNQKQITTNELKEIIEQLESEYKNLSQEYKACEVIIESKVRQKDIIERQTIISRELNLLTNELDKTKDEEIDV